MSSISRETQVMASSSLSPPAAPIQSQGSASLGRRLEALNATSPPSLLQTRSEITIPPRNQRGTTTGSSGIIETSSIVGSSSSSRNSHNRLTDTTTAAVTMTGGGSTTNVSGTGGGDGVFSPSSTFPMHKRLQRLTSSPAPNFNNDGIIVQNLSTAFDPTVVLPNAIQLDGIGSAGNSSSNSGGAIIHGHTSSIPDSILRTPNSKRADVPSLDGMVPSCPKARSTTSRNRAHSEAIVNHHVITGTSGTGPGPNGRGTTSGDSDEKDTPMMGLTVPTTTATSKRPLHSTKLSSLDNKQYDKRKAPKTTSTQGSSSHTTILAIETNGSGVNGMPLNSGNVTSSSPANGSMRGRRKPPRAQISTPTNAAVSNATTNNTGTSVAVVDNTHRQQGKGTDAVDVFEITHDQHPHTINHMDMNMNVVIAGGGAGGGGSSGSSSNSVSSSSDHPHHHPSSGPSISPYNDPFLLIVTTILSYCILY